MKFFNQRLTSLFILIIYIITLTPAVVFSAEEELIPGGDFESEELAASWLGSVRDTNCAYEGDWGIQVLNPYGDEASGLYGHIVEYNDTVNLEEGKFYTFSAYVMNPAADDDMESTASAYVGRGGDVLFIDISSVGYEWSLVTASFMATENSSPNLIVTLEGGDIDTGFFMDSVSILPETRVPSYTVIEGPDRVFIPDSGYADYRYSVVTYDTDDLPINVLINELDLTIDNLPDGVEFAPSGGHLRVHSHAPEDVSFTLTCSAQAGISLRESSKSITTTKNLLSDPGFDYGEEKWISDKSIDYSDGQLTLYADESGDYGKYTSISYTEQLFLLAGNMYVFRADVGSSEEFDASSVFISNLSFASSGYAEINITGIGGEYTRVTRAFLIEDTGLYDLTLNLYAPTERPIYIDNVYLGIEDEAPTALSIHAPGNIQIPSEVTVLPCYSNVLNQLGEVMEDYEPQLTISPEEEGVYLEDGQIIVESNAKGGEYVIDSSFDDLSAQLTISVSTDAIGDGGFEEKAANEWWTASDGAVFSIIDYDGDKSAHVYSADSACLVINNSYMELTGGKPYVYSASAGFGQGMVTAFIADAYTGEYIPFAQYDPLCDVCIPFNVDETVLGRLVLYIEAEDSVGLLFDDISINPGELYAYDVIIEKGGHGDFLNGSYSFANNMSTESDADISATRWYIASSSDGHYEPIGVPNQNFIEITEDMVGQYIMYEVTPICAYTGLVGESVRSLPLLISLDEATDDTSDKPLSAMTPIELDSVKTHSFIDITSHWSEEMIASLSAAGIISGRSAGRFVPDFYITRAEFTAMIARAFSLVSMPYSGQFDDVSADDWYAGWIEACYKRGIIQGKSKTAFSPDERITREEMATIIYRAYLLAQGPLPYDLELRYYDSFMISPWAYESVKNCTNLNLFTGDTENLFKPQDYATRAEAAACLYRTLKSF